MCTVWNVQGVEKVPDPLNKRQMFESLDINSGVNIPYLCMIGEYLNIGHEF